MVVDDSDVTQLITTPDLLRIYVVYHFKSEDHGSRSSLQLTMIIHD